MKSLLLHRRRSVDLQSELPRHAASLRDDLELDTLAESMARGDRYLLPVALNALLHGPENDVDTILYRQAVLDDCLRNEDVVREMYALCVAAVESKRERYLGFLSRHPTSVLFVSVRAMRTLVGMLRSLRRFADDEADAFTSEGFDAFFAMLRKELSDDYLDGVERHLRELEFRKGVLISAGLGQGNESIDHSLRVPRNERRSLLGKLLRKGTSGYSFRVADRDDAGARILSELKARGLNLVANALAQSTDHIFSFFEMLRAELGFYVGCVNLHEALGSRNVAVSFPGPDAGGARTLRFSGLRDPCLALSLQGTVTGNNVDANGRSFVVVTGANQGGKSTFLRSLGLAQLMMQAGMFVAAESFEADVCTDLFTHFRREEDASMRSGKLDEELSRMSEIVEDLSPGAIVLFNESFASTNEREGSEIARQVVSALLDKGVRVYFVTHLHAFARRAFDLRDEGALFLRAERKADGTRTFRMVEAEPLETSHGADLYRRVFGAEETRSPVE